MNEFTFAMWLDSFYEPESDETIWKIKKRKKVVISTFALTPEEQFMVSNAVNWFNNNDVM